LRLTRIAFSDRFRKTPRRAHRRQSHPRMRTTTRRIKVYAVGIFNFWPTTILSVARSLADLRALMVVLWALAMCERVSPDLTK